MRRNNPKKVQNIQYFCSPPHFVSEIVRKLLTIANDGYGCMGWAKMAEKVFVGWWVFQFTKSGYYFIIHFCHFW